MNETTRYPLCWPAHWKRTTSRRRAPFGSRRNEYDAQIGQRMYRGTRELSVADAILRLDRELRALSATRPVISTNIPVRNDGIPRSGMREPSDPGVAVYWERKGKKQCMAIDRYDRVADNIAAIAATLEYLRGIERHGGGAILDRAFEGFAQLPAAIVTARPWREVFGFASDSRPGLETVEDAFRSLAKQLHPDTSGGDHDRMVELNEARRQAHKELLLGKAASA